MANPVPEIPSAPLPRGLARPVVELCERLERAGVAAYLQGEGLLDAWLGTTRAQPPTHSIVCLGPPARLLATLPTAVVTGERATRLTQASDAGPVDLIPIADGTIEAALERFGLAALAIAVRPAENAWADPGAVRDALAKHELPLLPGRPNPFVAAPRRFWIAALLIAEYGLEPTRALVDAAHAALPEVAERLPGGAPARRILDRILACPAPARALAFLRECGASPAILPGLDPAMEERLETLAALPSLRWAAYLRGTATARALARLRMPQGLARRIGRLQESHPLDRTIEGARDAQIRRAMTRLSPDELDGLIAWRRSELASEPAAESRDRGEPGEAGPGPGPGAVARDRLAKIESAIDRIRHQAATVDSMRTLALGGGDVMRILAAGPGPHVGRALAHLARVIAEDPARNTPAALEAELRAWQAAAGERVD
ncbi:MAG: hypothetical protein IPK00_09850 [Deltaproteobacteria bacterium]|nr:hypothetical protein [Deltaproteobacteria bacterium]